MTPNSVLFDTTLPAKARLLWSALEHFSGQHRTCWPGYTVLAQKVGCSARWIPELLKELVKAGLVLVQYRQGKASIYTLLGRVARQKPTLELKAEVPWKQASNEQKQPPKTNDKGGSTPSYGKKKEGIDFSKYGPGGKYPASPISQ
ncbi:MAG: helix-turn-helix domain-containing protein [Taibaiella sp.]|nr:helix-turn-helix domain-containing protein [Taibaiella sp.]